MTWRSDKVETGMNSGVRQRNSVDSGFGIQELFVAGLDEVDDRVPTFRIVDGIAETWNDTQRQVVTSIDF